MSESDGGRKALYSYRYIKLIIPYLLAFGSITIISHTLENKTCLDYLYYLSTLKYWTHHQGAWFIAMLIPLYAIAPILFGNLKTHSTFKTSVYILIIIPLLYLTISYMQFLNSNIIYNIQFVLIRIPSFILGMYFAPYIKLGQKLSIWFLTILMVAALIILYVSKHLVYSYLCFIIPFIVVFIWLIEHYHFIRKPLRFFGDISLESYLFNISLPSLVIIVFDQLNLTNSQNIIMYMAVFVLGTGLSYYTNKLSKYLVSIIISKIKYG